MDAFKIRRIKDFIDSNTEKISTNKEFYYPTTKRDKTELPPDENLDLLGFDIFESVSSTFNPNSENTLLSGKSDENQVSPTKLISPTFKEGNLFEKDEQEKETTSTSSDKTDTKIFSNQEGFIKVLFNTLGLSSTESSSVGENDNASSTIFDPTLESYPGFAKLDPKQSLAFHIIVSSFIIRKLPELIKNKDLNLDEIRVSLNLPQSLAAHQLEDSFVKEIKQKLHKTYGGREQLIMFLTGIGGGGKTKTLNDCHKFCMHFCTKFGLHFDDNTIKFSAIPGQAAALLPNGQTLHSMVGLNTKDINDVRRQLKGEHQ